MTNPKDLIGRNKPSLSYVPPVALIHLAEAMRHGAEKYGPYNWREQPVSRTVYIDAAIRHLLRMLDGQVYDDDSALPHEAHVMACMAILLDASACGTEEQDVKSGTAGRKAMERSGAVEQMIQVYSKYRSEKETN